MSTATTQPVAAGTWKIDTIHSHVGFAVKHMVVSTFRGRFEDYDGALSVGEDGAPRLQGSVNVDSIVVKDENRAGHLKSGDFRCPARFSSLTTIESTLTEPCRRGAPSSPTLNAPS